MYRARRLFALMFILLACLAFFTRVGRAQTPPILINEILVGNAGTTLDTDYTNFSGWIELRNTTGSAINLSKYKFVSLRDGATTPDSYVIAGRLTLPANGRLILWADEKKKGPHLPFEMDMDGGELSLFNPAGNLVTSLVFGAQSPDVSYGRSPDGGNTWAYFDQPTPGAANTTPAFANNNAAAFAARPQFSVAGGLHNGPLAVTLNSPDAGATIRYTIDGSRPNDASPLYTGPIAINANTVLRARAWAAGKMVSPTATQTYLLNVPANLPVISLVLDPPYLWNPQIGIYVKGTNGLKDCRGTANWHQKWERPGNIEFYETTGQNRVNQEVGVEISGNCTRNFPQKSFEIKARKHYGDNDMDYAFFPGDKPMTSYKRLILRNGGNDNFRAFMRDSLAHNIAAGRMDLDRQAYRPAVVYLNGEYWGLYEMREKMDEDYVENNYNLDENQFDMLEKNFRVINGSDAAFKSFYNYVMGNNPAQPGVYAEIQSRMDIESFVDYLALETYFANHDWGRNNVRYWDDYAATNRWRWVLQDLDLGFLEKNLKRDSVSFAFGTNNPTFRIARKLWENPDFRDLFVQRYAVHLNTTFAPARVTGIINAMADGMRAEMPAHTARWGRPESPAAWEADVQILRNMAAQRPSYVREHLRNRAGNKPDSTLTVAIQGDGRARVAGVEVPAGYSGPHFRNVPITLTAVPNPGAVFGYWLETGETSPTITIPFAGDTTRTAVFDEEPPPPPPPDLVINEIHYQPQGPQTEANNEFVEIYSNESAVVDLGGYTIPAISYTFPAGSTIHPDEYIVVTANSADPAYAALDVDNVFDFGWGSPDNQKLSNGGETVALVDTFGQAADSVTYDDIAPWPNAPDGGGPSLSLVDPSLDNALPGSWAASRQSGGSPGAENFPPLPPVPPVVINELNYRPGGGADEFIELTNTGSEAVALDGFAFEGIDYTFPAGTDLPAGGYWVVESINWTGDLDDAGETVTLKDGDGQVVDTVTYDDVAPWPTGIDGTGPTLSLGNPGLDNSLPASWAASREAGGTPGAENFPPLPIVINELHHTPTGGSSFDNPNEFLELYNAGAGPVDLSGYTFVGVDPPTGFSSSFPAGSIIDPGEYIVVADTPATYAGGYQVFDFDGGLSGNGETITLRDPFGNEVDSVIYGDGDGDDWPSAPDGGGPSLSLLDPALDNTVATNWAASRQNGGSPGAENFPVLPTPPIVINEIHYNPGGGAAEFIELFNNGADPAALDGFTFEGVTYTFPAGTTLPAGGYLALAASEWTGGDLADDGETVALKDAIGQVVDTVTYGDVAPWPAAPDGGGPSLSLLDPSSDNSLPESWAASTAEGGTPGAANDVPAP